MSTIPTNETMKNRILTDLKEGPRTMRYLLKKFPTSSNSIRGSISDIRKMGYIVEFIDNHYILKDTNDSKISDWIERNKFFNCNLHYSTISLALKISLPEIDTAVQNLFKRYHIIQTSKSSAIFKKL